MLNYSTSSSAIRWEVDLSTCLLCQAMPPGVVGRVVSSGVAPPQYFEPVSREIPELVCGEKDELARCPAFFLAGAHR